MFSTRAGSNNIFLICVFALAAFVIAIVVSFGLILSDSSAATKSISNSLDISQAKAQSIKEQLDDYNVNYDSHSKFVKTKTGFKLYSKDNTSRSIIFDVDLKDDKVTNVSKS
jgi:hypothetical protein